MNATPMPSTGRAQDWHTLAPAATLERLEARAEGLSSTEARSRFATYGPNRLVAFRATRAWEVLFDQVRSLVVLVLFAAAIVAFALGGVLEAIAIGAVLTLNALIGFATELRARRAMEGLLRLDVSRARVLRDGVVAEIEAAGVVPGDVITIEAGDSIPADARLLDGAELRVDEAALTGESVPVMKRPDVTLDATTPLADRTTMLYKGTIVVAGTGHAAVVETGMRTEVGRIGALVGGITVEKTPLERRLDALGRRLIWLTFGVTALVVATGLLRGIGLLYMIETGIALAIAAVPEGLPAVATIALSVGLRRMAARNALIRRLPAVEALGSVTVICTDKTGTLTAGAMTVTEIWTAGTTFTVSGIGYAPTGEVRPSEPRAPLTDLLRVATLTNDAGLEHADGWRARGDPTDAALLTVARKAGIEPDQLHAAWPEEGEVPFSSERMLMATFHRSPDGSRAVLVKGAPEAVLDRCNRLREEEAEPQLTAATRDQLLERNAQMAGRGLRVIAFAHRFERPDGASLPLGPDALDDLVFLGLAGMIDPPADGVPETIQRFRAAGIRTVMLTGDQQRTAEAIARRLHVLEPEQSTLGARDLASLSLDALAQRVRTASVFYRVGPEDKLRITDALQRSGEIVAMLGDGVNDAAALRKADVGVAMGQRGTDIAKDAADVILRDDRFPTVGAAIEEGRVIFENIRKFAFYLFSCNLAEVLLLFIAGVVGWPLPLLPLQILWLNLVTDTLPALALAIEPSEPGVMARPPRDPDDAILSRRVIVRIAGFAALITVVSLAAFQWALQTADDPATAQMRASTYAFMTIALAQILHLGNARSHDAVVSPKLALANRWAVAAVIASVGLQVLAVHFAPLARLLEVVPLSLSDWLVITGLSALPALVGQVEKLVRRGRPRERR